MAFFNKFIFIFLLLFSSTSLGASIKFFVGDKLIKELSLEEMLKITGTHDIKLYYHFSRSPVKHYRAVKLAPILRGVYGKTLKEGIYTEAVLEALDGYKSYSTLATMTEEGGHIAFKDLDVKKGWEAVGFRMSSPAPFFLVWNKKGQTTANNYPWPFALEKITLVKFSDKYPSLVPSGKKRNSAEYRGYTVFKAQCFRCHSINRQGGKIGPDLAAPQNITSYRSKEYLRQFIRDPKSFRYSKMPSHKHLSHRSIDDLLAYLALFKFDHK